MGRHVKPGTLTEGVQGSWYRLGSVSFFFFFFCKRKKGRENEGWEEGGGLAVAVRLSGSPHHGGLRGLGVGGWDACHNHLDLFLCGQ